MGNPLFQPLGPRYRRQGREDKDLSRLIRPLKGTTSRPSVVSMTGSTGAQDFENRGRFPEAGGAKLASEPRAKPCFSSGAAQSTLGFMEELAARQGGASGWGWTVEGARRQPDSRAGICGPTRPRPPLQPPAWSGRASRSDVSPPNWAPRLRGLLRLKRVYLGVLRADARGVTCIRAQSTAYRLSA